MDRLIRLISPAHRPTVLEAVADLGRFRMLEPGQTMGQGVDARRRQWETISGRRAKREERLWMVIAGFGGAVVGAILSTQIPETAGVPQAPIALAAAAAGAVLGAVGAKVYGGMAGFQDCMMLVVVNERESVALPEKVTGQAEIWIPKVLLFWRSFDWRYQNGKAYLWLELPEGATIHESLRWTLDYVFLSPDRQRALNAAIYSQRSTNRMVSDNALDHADVETGDDGSDRLNELLPYLTAGGIAIGGILLVVLTQ